MLHLSRTMSWIANAAFYIDKAGIYHKGTWSHRSSTMHFEER